MLKRQHWVGANNAVGAARLDRESDRRADPRRRGGVCFVLLTNVGGGVGRLGSDADELHNAVVAAA